MTTDMRTPHLHFTPRARAGSGIQAARSAAVAACLACLLEATADVDPTPVGRYGSGAWGICVAANRAYLADPDSGLKIVDVTNPAEPYLLGTYRAPAPAWRVAVSGNLAYVAAEAAGLIIVNVSDPTSPIRVGSYNTGESAYDVFLAGNLAYVADGQDGLVVIDVSNPAAPKRVGGLDGSGEVWQVVVAGKYAYLADRFWNGAELQPYGALRIMDVSDPSRPKLVGQHQTEGQAWHLALSGQFAYVGADTLEVFDVSDPANPRRVGAQAPGGAVAVNGSSAFVSNYQSGLHVFDVSDPASPRPSGHADCAGYARSLAVAGRYAYVAASGVGVQIFDVGASTPEPLPPLHIELSEQKVMISWPASVTGATLETCEALVGPTAWTPETTAPEVSGDQNVVTLDAGAAARFFRLRKP